MIDAELFELGEVVANMRARARRVATYQGKWSAEEVKREILFWSQQFATALSKGVPQSADVRRLTFPMN